MQARVIVKIIDTILKNETEVKEKATTAKETFKKFMVN